MVWGKTPDDYRLPNVLLEAPDAPWLADAAVGSWSLDRELVASTIPGNIRERTGLSIGAASVTVRTAQRATPWSKTPATRVATGLAASLIAEDATGDRKQLGRWVTDEPEGDLSSQVISIDLLEAQYAGRDLPQLLPAYEGEPFTATMPVDPVWPISRLLAQAGFPAAPSPSAGNALLVLPLDGAVQPEAGASSNYAVSGTVVNGWRTLPDEVNGRGAMCPGNGSIVSAIAAGSLPLTSRFRAGQSVTYTLDVRGTVWLADISQQWMVRIVNDPDTSTRTVAVSNNASTTAVSSQVPIPGPSNPTWPNRIQVQIERTWNPTTQRWTQTRARARRSYTGAWSSWSTASSTTAVATPGIESLRVVGGASIPGTAIPSSPPVGRFGALSVIASDSDAAVWAPPLAKLAPLGGDIGFPFVPAGADVWQAIQDCASANLAAVIVDLDGIARVLNRDDLAGVNDPGEILDVGRELDDLPWSQDSEDAADRVEVTFSPPTFTKAVPGSSELAPEAWAAADVITVQAGQSVTVPAVFDGLGARGIFTSFVVPTSPSPAWSQSSTVIAFDTPDGTGTLIPEHLFHASVVQTSASTATVTVTNKHSSPIYLVDGNGEPHLVLRAAMVATYATPQIVARGAAADTAKAPMTVNLTPWVQTEAQAKSVAGYLWDRVSGGGLWKAASVRCRLDWSLDIGEVRRLQHEGSGLELKVLITKVPLAGNEGEITQSLDLVLIPWTFADLAEAWPSTATFAHFAAVWPSSATFADFATDPLWTGA